MGQVRKFGSKSMDPGLKFSPVYNGNLSENDYARHA